MRGKALAVLLVCAPTLLMSMDQIGVTLPFDPLTISILLGAVGIVLLGGTERQNKRRMWIVVGLSVIAFIVQIYAIAVFTLHESNLSYSEIIIQARVLQFSGENDNLALVLG